MLTAGSVTVNGRPYAAHAAPLREVGALLTVLAGSELTVFRTDSRQRMNARIH
jgi:hypothetical protein